MAKLYTKGNSVNLIAALSAPAQVRRDKVLLSYDQKGQFTHLMTLKPSYLFTIAKNRLDIHCREDLPCR